MSPLALAHSISRTDASTSCSMIWAIPARRPGAWLQKSASHRLCAWRPAAPLEVAVGGARRLLDERDLGEERRDVLGKMTSATTPSASISAAGAPSSSCGRRRPRWCRRRGSRTRRPSGRSRRGTRRQERLVPGDARPAVTVGGDHDVPVSGGAHGQLPSVRRGAPGQRLPPMTSANGQNVGVERPGVGDVAGLGWCVTSWRPAGAQSGGSGRSGPTGCRAARAAVDVLDVALLEGRGDVDDAGGKS